MKHKKKTIAGSFLLTLLLIQPALVAFHVYKKPLKQETFGNRNSDCKIAISGVQSMFSTFKQEIIEALKETYSGKCFVRIDSLRNLDEISEEEFSSIIIMDENQADMNFDLSLKSKIRDTKDKTKLILLITNRDGQERSFSYNGVDAITTASAKEKKDLTLTAIKRRIAPNLAKVTPLLK